MAAASHNPSNVQPGTSRDGTHRPHNIRRHSKADDGLHTQIQIDQSETGSRIGTEVDDEMFTQMEPETIPIYDIRLFNQQRRTRRYSTTRSLPISLAVTPISELDTYSPLSSQWVIISEPRRAESTSLSYLSSQRSTNTYNSATHFEEAFTKAGGFYNYQLRVLIVLCLASLYCGPSMLIWYFMHNIPNHRCRVPMDNSTTIVNSSHFIYPQLDNFIPKKGYWTSDLDPCSKFDVSISSSPKAAVVHCDHFVFEKSKSFVKTPVVQFEMVCQNQWMWYTSKVSFNVGLLIGAALFGLIADKFGRRPSLLTALFVLTISGVSEVLVSDPKIYMILVGFTAAGIVGTYQSAFILALELVGSSQRRPVGFTFYIFFQVGYFISTFYVYFIRDWKLQKVALVTPGLIFIIYWWILPESAQWFLVKGRTKEAEEMLTRVAHVNKRLDGGSIVFENNRLPNSAKEMFLLDSVPENQKKSSSNSTSHNKINIDKGKPVKEGICTEFLVESQPRNSFIVIFIVMLLVGIGPKASRLYAIFKLYDNVYVEYLINGSLEIGGALMGILFSPFFNRRQLFLVSSIVVSASFILMAILTIYDHWELFWIRIIIWKVFISTAVSNLLVMAAELFPTQARATLFGLCLVFLGIGEYINVGLRADSKQKGFIIGKKDPFVFYGFVSAAAGLLILLLPEMYNKPLPNTFADCKDFSSYDRDFPGLIKIMQKIHGAKQSQRVQEILEERRRESQAALKPRKKSHRSRTAGSSVSGHGSTDNSSQQKPLREGEFSRLSTPLGTPEGIKHSSSKSSLNTYDTIGMYSPFMEPLRTPTKETPAAVNRPKSKIIRKGSVTSTFEMLEERKKKQRELGTRMMDAKVNAKRKRKNSESESSFAAFETRDQQTQVMLENASLASLCENDL